MNEERAVAKLLSRKNPSSLTEQQKQFVLEYMLDLNATQAAIRAGYPPTTASKVGHRLVKPGTTVGNAVAQALAARSVRVGISADRVLREAAKIAFGDPRVLFREDGSLRTPDEYDENDGAMIEGIKTRRIVEVGLKEDGSQGMVPVEIQEVKLASKLPAITLLARHLGLLNDKLEVNITSRAQRLDEAFKRTGQQPLANDEDDAIEGEFEDVTEAPAQVGPETWTPEQAAIARRLLTLQNTVQQAADDEPFDLATMLS